MNLIYMHTHDSGRCFEPYGYPVQTPAIMELAQESLQFNQCFCACPTCSPSRAALLTGMTAHSSGMLGLAHRGFALNDYNQHLASYLAAQGFETVLIGVQHEAAGVHQPPYHRRLRCDASILEKRDGVRYDLANIQIMQDFLREKHETPFFLSYGLRNTHRPFPVHEGSADHVQPLPCIPNCAETRGDTADFHASIACVDTCVQALLDTLKETGLDKNTILLFTTDHGPAFPRMKCNLTDGGIGVTLLLKYPGNPAAGRVTDQIVSHTDIFPTLCDLLHIEKPAWLQGTSLLPVIERDEPVHDAIFSEVNYHAAYEPLRCIRTKRYKLIRRYDWHRRIIPANVDNSPCRTVMKEAGLFDEVLPMEEMHDLLLDPREQKNLVADENKRDIYEDLSRRLLAWMQATDDPLLKTPARIPRPEGARVNRLESPEADPPIPCWEE